MTAASSASVSSLKESVARQSPSSQAWIFSPAVDLTAFLGSAILSLLLLTLGATQGWLHASSPEWTWVTCVLAVDVAHVWSTAFRAYFEPIEWNRRPMLLLFVPLAGALIASSLYSQNDQWFWRCLAYLAVWHFVRQQQGWMAWYRRKANEPQGWELWIDRLAIYSSMIYPLIHWHAHLPREFAWFTNGDFAKLPAWIETLAWPVYLASLTAYALKSLRDWFRRQPRIGKDILLVTTALCWYLGIVTFNSDYAFTVTNVLIHGIPYLVLIVWYRAEQPLVSGARLGSQESSKTKSALSPTSEPDNEQQQIAWDEEDTLETAEVIQRAKHWQRWFRAAVIILATVWLLAYLEELLWDRWVWHERSWLFGGAGEGDSFTWLTPLLAVPQITHYLLDGFLWRRSDMTAESSAN